jgi:Holliday junction resolvase
MKEQIIQTKIINYLHRNGAYSIKTISTNSGGTPDVICCFKGHFLAIEVKKPGGKVSDLQKHHINRIKEAGGIAVVAYGIDEVREALIEAGLI